MKTADELFDDPDFAGLECRLYHVSDDERLQVDTQFVFRAEGRDAVRFAILASANLPDRVECVPVFYRQEEV